MLIGYWELLQSCQSFLVWFSCHWSVGNIKKSSEEVPCLFCSKISDRLPLNIIDCDQGYLSSIVLDCDSPSFGNGRILRTIITGSGAAGQAAVRYVWLLLPVACWGNETQNSWLALSDSVTLAARLKCSLSTCQLLSAVDDVRIPNHIICYVNNDAEQNWSGDINVATKASVSGQSQQFHQVGFISYW